MTTIPTPLFTPLGLDHVVLRVRDQERTIRFYCDVLGATVDRVNARISLVHLRFGGQFIDLLPAPADLPEPGQRGIDHVALSIACDSLESVAAALSARGVALEGDIVKRYGAFGDGPSLYLRDPDGYVVELKPRPAP
jgi:catechol 2,3-dioxygenase-like lactoylglutathione lyase family enzyme